MNGGISHDIQDCNIPDNETKLHKELITLKSNFSLTAIFQSVFFPRMQYILEWQKGARGLCLPVGDPCFYNEDTDGRKLRRIFRTSMPRGSDPWLYDSYK